MATSDWSAPVSATTPVVIGQVITTWVVLSSTSGSGGSGGDTGTVVKLGTIIGGTISERAVIPQPLVSKSLSDWSAPASATTAA